jgi:CubicO group peptidase (beta-lactamase class C family)
MSRTNLFHLFLLASLLFLLGGCAAPPAATVAATARPVEPIQATGLPDLPADLPAFPGSDWPVSTPEEQGLDGEKLAGLPQAIEQQKLAMDSFLVIRNGAIVGEWYFDGEKPGDQHPLWSVTKSFASTLIGIAIDQGLLAGVQQPLAELLPQAAQGDQPELRQALTLEHVLTMNTGLGWLESDATFMALYRSDDWPAFVLGQKQAAAPGSEFNYCSGCSHLLTTIVEDITGDAEKFAVEQLFEPLGIQDYTWEQDPQGVPVGGWGLELTGRDMARLGYLFLQQGRWGAGDGSLEQVVSSEWVAQATAKHSESDGELGYGYQWWTLPAGDAYAALGRDGQTIYVNPGAQLVVVTTASGVDHGRIFDLIETYLLAAVQ